MNGNEMRVGLLAYGAIGDEHNRALGATAGLRLTAVCDTNPERLAAALALSPEIQTFVDATEMLNSGEIDLVVVSTPPNSHYSWAKAALTRGLNVVLEKPMALTTEQCDELIALSAQVDRLLVVYQNRRYDSDFVTLKNAIDSGLIGEVFHYESFVGGYSKPCSFWHSMADVSGGAIFDWGSHFIDQVLATIPSDVQHVSGLNQKRVWTHVTNADHAQVTITFTDGVQAIFTNTDLAAARKPKFYILGTEGALVGNWDPAAGTSVADLPAIITLHRSDGTQEVVTPAILTPYSFHASLVTYLNDRTPMAVTAQQSRDVVAIMEAAEKSALTNGTLISPELLRKSSTIHDHRLSMHV